MSRSCDANPSSGRGIWWPPHGIVASTPSAANGRHSRSVLYVVDARQHPDPLLRLIARWATPISWAAKAMGPFPPPSEQRTASRARRGLSTASISRWSSCRPSEGSHRRSRPTDLAPPRPEPAPGRAPVSRPGRPVFGPVLGVRPAALYRISGKPSRRFR